jgi:hypothetical protein
MVGKLGPEITLHKPVPEVGATPARVTVVPPHTLLSSPAFAMDGGVET